MPKNAFFGQVVHKFCLRLKNFSLKIGYLYVIWESSENKFERPKKKVDKTFEIKKKF